MLSAASPYPLWDAVLRSLREMTRLAVAVLALSAGLGGAAVSAAPPSAAVPAAHLTAGADTRTANPAAPLTAGDAAVGRPAAAPGTVGAASRQSVHAMVSAAPAARTAAPAPVTLASVDGSPGRASGVVVDGAPATEGIRPVGEPATVGGASAAAAAEVPGGDLAPGGATRRGPPSA